MPKYVEIDAVERVNSRLDGVPSRSAAGDTRLFIRIEPYSCKLTGDDKKLYRHLRTTQGQGHGPAAASSASATSPSLHPQSQSQSQSHTSPLLLAAGSKRTATAAGDHDNHQSNQDDPHQHEHQDAHTQMQHMIGSPPKRQRTRVTSLTAMLQPGLTSAGAHSVIVAPPSPSRKINRQAAGAAAASADDPMTGVLDSNGLHVSPTPLGSAAANADMPVPTIDLGPAAIATSSAPNPDALLLSRSPNTSGGAHFSSTSASAAANDDAHNAGDMAHKTLAAFIAAMNAAYPDFDFSDSPAGVFRPVTLDDVRASMHTHMAHDQEHELWDALNAAFANAAEAAAGTSPGIHPKKEEASDAVVGEDEVRGLADYLGECEVYVFSPMTKDEDPLYEEGTIWSHTVLFFHRKLKRLALLKLRSSAAFLASDDDQSSLGTGSGARNLPIRAHHPEKAETGIMFAMDE